MTAAQLLVAALSLAGGALAASNGNCKGLNFTVNGISQNVVATGAVNPGNHTLNVTAPAINSSSYTTQTTIGTETFAAWYCEPVHKNANSSKLQVFRGSFFTNREMWTALGGTNLMSPPTPQFEPEEYSWFEYANGLGYPTLAIDSLGDGLSSAPDGLLVAQIPYDIALYHDLVTQIRSGTTGQLPRSYSTLIHISNSLGSTMGNWMAAYHPADFDAFVLTGYSNAVDMDVVGVALNLPAPGALIDPARFGRLPLDYVTSTLETSLTNSFFGDPSVVDFDPQAAHLFFTRRDVVSLGYVLTQYLPGNAPTAPTYTGRVLVLTGENDQAFCGLGSSALSPNASCGGLLAETGTLFPAADYNYYAVPRTGHAIILHKSVRTTFEVAHNFIAGASYAQ